ncbi:BON domain-containing protein [Dongia deserti]|uniref:BON domain-containing protein n=1 Tax=Dongia deserti TaxID=2268030 RepID=UPI000E64BE11|nr:BON domain-containing protein [Dongia deserti]
MRVAPCLAAPIVLVAYGALSGCSPVGTAIGAAAFTADLATQERGLYQGLDDHRMWIAINGRFVAADLEVAQNVHLQVQEGRVLLSGVVQKQEQRLAAVKAAWEEPGVREVINHIQIANSRDLGQVAQDEFLARRVWLKLFVDRQIRANNYSVECIDDVVYLIGVGQDEAEIQRVVDHTRDVAYVRDVKNYVRVKTDPLPPEPPPPANVPDIMPAEQQPGLDGFAQASES